MTTENFLLLKLTLGALATIGLYTVLYKENKLFRFFEHLFLGLAAGWSLVAMWTETLKEKWYDQIIGVVAEEGSKAMPGFYLYALIVPLSLMAYMVFNRKHNWMSRIPIGILLGFAGGQGFEVLMTDYGPQISNSMKPIIPQHWSLVPATPEPGLYMSQAITNLIFMVTFLCVLSYFIFSIDFKSAFAKGSSKAGRLLLMIGFGAIFGSTVMMRFTLLIDRMYYVWIEWLWQGILHK